MAQSKAFLVALMKPKTVSGGLRPDPLGELTALPRPPSWMGGAGAPLKPTPPNEGSAPADNF